MGQRAGWSVATMKLHAKPTKLLCLGQFHFSAMVYYHRQRQITCCYLTLVLLQMGTHCCLTTSSEVQATSTLLEKRFG